MSQQFKTKFLEPIRETRDDFADIEKKIKELFLKEIYYPLLKEIGEKRSKVKNSSSNSLLEAIRSGRIEFNRGTFTGKFSSQISSELRELGAKWDRASGSYKINRSNLPIEVRSAISSSEAQITESLSSIDTKLMQIVPEEIADKLNVSSMFDTTLWKTEKRFQDSVRGITLAPKLTREQSAKIATEWQENMRLYVRDFTEKEIRSLRKDIQKSAFSGNRRESMVKSIQKSYGVSENKAKFLARQETSLLLTKFKETRYVDAGVNEYEWRCVHMPHDKSPTKHIPGNVRYSHGILEGKIFRWDSPPITTAPGEPVKRNNPGQDYNCRCFAKPIVRFKKSDR